VEVVKATDIGLQGCVHVSQVDLSAAWLSVTPNYFHFYSDVENIMTSQHFRMHVHVRLHVCIHAHVKCSAQNIIYLEQGVSATTNLEMLCLFFFLYLLSFPSLSSFHLAAPPVFLIPLFSSLFSNALLFHPSPPIPFPLSPPGK
jgi:hypothetical protein